MTADAPRAADLLARRLAEAGCRHAFGMPGGEVLTLIDALEAAGIPVTLIHHENAAGFMAEGVWARTGAPGIMVATLGPGALNGLNAVANALQERVPLIVLTGCVDADTAQRYTHQVIDHAALFAPITKGSLRLDAPSADTVADRAITLASAPRAGPVHVDVPISVAAAPAPTGGPRLRRQPAAPATPAEGPVLARIRRKVSEARRPIVIAGLDAVAEKAGPALLAFAERLGAPVVTTYRAKGLVPEDHPLALGGAGLSPRADEVLVPLFGQADLVIAAGYDPIEMRAGWQDPWDPGAQTVIEIAPVDNDHYMHAASVELRTALAPTLAALTPPAPAREVWPGGEIAAARTALAEAFPRAAGWGPDAIIDQAQASLPPDAIATVDSGAHRILLSQMWRCRAPQTLLQSAGLCTMGGAIPLAAGAKLAEPDRVVAAFTGDAGFLMVAGELATLARLALPVIVVVFVDESLALIEMKQRARQLPNAAVDFARHDFAAIGRAFGGHGETVTDRDGLAAALDRACAADRFTVIAAPIAKGAYDGRI